MFILVSSAVSFAQTKNDLCVWQSEHTKKNCPMWLCLLSGTVNTVRLASLPNAQCIILYPYNNSNIFVSYLLIRTVVLGFNPLKPELNSICYLLTLLGAHHFLHVSRIRVKLLTFRLLMPYIYIYIYIYIWSTHS